MEGVGSLLFSIAGQIIEKLGSKALEEDALWWGVKDEIETLRRTVAIVRAVLLDAEEKQEHDSEVKEWLRRLKDVMYDAEDLLDDFSTEELQRRAMDGCRLAKEVGLFFSRSNQLAYSLKMGRKFKSLSKRLDSIIASRTSFGLVSRFPDPDRTGSGRETKPVVPDVVVGREEDKKDIIRRLLGSENFGVSIPVISIDGIDGIGKTTLAKMVFNDNLIQSHFELKVWVRVSDDFDIKAIVSKILEFVTKKRPAEAEIDVLIATLDEIINGKRFLLVLDDVWNEDIKRWDDLKKLLRCGGVGSRVLVTTCQSKVATMASGAVPQFLLKLEGLSELESWSLLAKMAFDDGEESRKSSLECIGREIVKKCGGVPLVIKTIGNVLYFKKTREEWSLFNTAELARVKQDEGAIMSTLKLSYNHLSSQLKHCFAYCSLFPKGYRIDVETLVQLWIAQGFVTRSSHGLECFTELLSRSFFQEVDYDEWGNIVSCKMHHLMHDLATFVGESHLILTQDKVGIQGKFLHVSFGCNLESSKQIPKELKPLRTFLLPCQVWMDRRVESKVHETILHDFRVLRALDLHSLALNKLPSSCDKKLKHLRYLDLSYNRDIRALPNSITKLQHLQVLKLRGCSLLSELPKDIGKLKNLECLDCRGCGALSHMPQGLGQLTSLWRLTVFVVSKGSASKYKSGGLKELRGLNNLTGSLEINNLGNVRNGEREFEDANLEGKNLLQSLHLDWGRDVGYNWAVVDIGYEEICFERLRPHRNLKGLRVDGYGGVRFPSWFSSLMNLVKIKIHNCGRIQCLQPFHQFPYLAELEICFASELKYIVEDNDSEINIAEFSSSLSSTLFFPSLKSLSLVGCPKLKGWWESEGGTSAAKVPSEPPQFHRLSRLRILWCPNLTQMPLFPFLTDELKLEGSSVELLRQTMDMKRSSTMATSSSSSCGALRPLSELKVLSLHDIGGLESLPEEWLQNLTSLQLLELWNCPNLKSLPQGMKQNHLTSLQRLSIWSCPQLEERCRKGGVDWSNISLIPNIEIDQKPIKTEGRYLLDDEKHEAPSASEPQRTAAKSVLEHLQHICDQVNWMVDHM